MNKIYLNIFNQKSKMKKKVLGQYFTKFNVFDKIIFGKWLDEAIKNSKNKVILEPFVGNEDIINLLKINFSFKYQGYDIDPKTKNTIEADTLKDFPKDYDIAITNPPYLAHNSATRKGLIWNYKNFDDLYKVSLNKMLANCKYVAAIIPATLIKNKFFHNRLSDYILLNVKMFKKTDVPVCLALFKPKITDDFNIWEFQKTEVKFIKKYKKLKKEINLLLKPKRSNIKIKFNDYFGKYGILATDKSFRSIQFIEGSKIPDVKVKFTSRNMVRFSMSDENISVAKLNEKLYDFFNKDGEIILASFKSLRKDQKYRRRLDFNMIKKIVASC